MDDLQAKLAANVLTELFKESAKGVKSLASYIKQTADAHDFFGSVARRYSRLITDRHGWIKILGMTTPAPLEQLFVRVNILTKLTFLQHRSIDELQELFDRHQAQFGLVEDTKQGNDAVNEFSKFVLLGKPGSGKTTFLRYIATHSFSDTFAFKAVPIFISLKVLSDSGNLLFGEMAREFDGLGLRDGAGFLTVLLQNGNAIVLLDGLDEVTSDKLPDTIRQIVSTSDKYPRNRYIVSCRTAAYNNYFDKFTDIEMADFGATEIASFVKNWFSHDPQKGTLCLAALLDSVRTRDLAATPLLLTMLCLAYDETMDFSANRAELYRDAIDALLKRWDISRMIVRTYIYKNLTLKRKEDMFASIAATTFEQGKYFWPSNYIESLIFNFIRHLPNVQEHEATHDASAVLRSIEEQHGILVARARGVYSFLHLTFHEYFTALYIVNDGPRSQKALVDSYLTDMRWREVIILVANLLPTADVFMFYILKKMAAMGFDGSHASGLYRILKAVEDERLEEFVNPLQLKSDARMGMARGKTPRAGPKHVTPLRVIGGGRVYQSKVRAVVLKERASLVRTTLRSLMAVFARHVQYVFTTNGKENILGRSFRRKSARTSIAKYGAECFCMSSMREVADEYEVQQVRAFLNQNIIVGELLWWIFIHHLIYKRGLERVRARECFEAIVEPIPIVYMKLRPENGVGGGISVSVESEKWQLAHSVTRVFDELVVKRELLVVTGETRNIAGLVQRALVDDIGAPLSGEVCNLVSKLRASLNGQMEEDGVEMFRQMEEGHGRWFIGLASEFLRFRLSEELARINKMKGQQEVDAMISEDGLQKMVMDRYNDLVFENVQLQCVQVAELVLAILDTPVYVRGETREAALLTVASIEEAAVELPPSRA